MGNSLGREMDIPSKLKIRNSIWLESELFYSKAFHSLSRSAILTLMRCYQKRKWEKSRKGKRVYTNDGFLFPYSEAKALGIAGATQHWKNINALIEVGILDMIHQGGWYQKHEREKDYSIYQFSERWRQYGTPQFVKVAKAKTLLDRFHVRANMERGKLKATSQKRSGQLHRNEGDRVKTGNNRLHKNEGDEMRTENRQTLARIA